MLASAGFNCTGAQGTEETQRSLERYGFYPLACHDGSAVIWSSDVVRASLEAQPYNQPDPGQEKLAGLNWSVTAPADRIDALRKVLLP